MFRLVKFLTKNSEERQMQTDKTPVDDTYR